MRQVLSTHLFVNHRLTTAALDRIANAGISAVEIFCARQHIDWRNSAQTAELAHFFSDSNLQLWSLHSPMYSDEVWGRSGPHAVIDITEPVKARRIAQVDEVKRALEIAENIPVRYLVQHLGVSGAEFDERRMEAGFTSLEELKSFAKQRGVEILLENIPNGFSSAAALNRFNGQTHLDLNYCFDIGHAHLSDDIEGEYTAMKTRIRSTHLHDNDGKEDSHLFPFLHEAGTIDWSAGLRLLSSRPEQYPLLLELREDPDKQQPLESVRDIFERFDSLLKEQQ